MKSLNCLLGLLGMGALLVCGYGCSGGEDTAGPGDGDTESGSLACTIDEECPPDQYCGPSGFCVPSQVPDGDGENGAPDGDGTDEPINTEGAAISCPDRLDYGAMLLGDPRPLDALIQSTGTGSLIISAIQLASDNADFTFENLPSLPATLPPGTGLTFQVIFTPSMPYAVTDTLLIAHNGPGGLCRVSLTSEYKGESAVSFDPIELLFGNVGVDDPPVVLPLNVCNEGTGNKVVTVSSIGFKMPLTASQFTFDMENEPAAGDPLYLNTGECFVVNVAYDPSEPTFYPQIHENYLVVSNDADNTVEGRSELRMQGSSNEDALDVSPNPIDFQTVNIGETATLAVLVQNYAGKPVEVSDIRLTGNHCEEFQLYLGDHGTFPFTIAADEVINDMGVGYLPMNTGADQGCFLMISSDLAGPAQYSKTAVTGSGREENQKPIAKVSRRSSGSDIVEPIEIPPNATDAQKRITLYGDVSNDPDGNYPLTYEWTLTKPDESNTVIHSPTESVISVQVDWQGPYTVTLVVTDTEGAVSDPKNILINVGTNEKVTIDMEFSGSGKMNVELEWLLPNGQKCSDEIMTTTRYCPFTEGNGSAYVSNYTSRYDVGNRETVVHSSAPDGSYTIQAIFKEDCASWDLNWVCFDRNATDITVRIFVNMETEPRHTVTKHLESEGQIAQWFINKVGGQWNAPTSN